jgi:para-nitrobenzyl esterase
MKRAILSLSVSLIFSSVLFAQNQETSAIKVTGGLVSGIVEKNGMQIFKGIPFAAPPTGNFRWKAPQPLKDWSDVRKCVAFSASAIQETPAPFFLWSQEFIAPATPLSEDCLYLNVWTKSVTEKKPVIVWIHGGGFTGGSGSVPVYDGEAMAAKGVVFVTINYRLGVFGFLAHPELTREAPYQSSGNYALLDQIAALQWVKSNISVFGGDSDRVTVAGQSAGAFSICALVASPLAKGLFQRAIAESGGMFNRDGRLKTLKDAEQVGSQLAAKFNAATIQQLRDVSANEILAAGANISSPVVDGYLLPKDINSAFKVGAINDVPLLTGWNEDEGFAPQFPLSAEKFEQRIKKNFGDLAAEMLKAFPATTDDEAAASQKALSRDQLFAWQNYTWATMQVANGKSKAWLYIFDKTPPGEPDNGAFHSSEVPYALHNLDLWSRPWKSSDRKIEELMSSYWINFATTGDPNGAGLPLWPAVETGNVKAMRINANSKVVSNPLKKELEVLSKYESTVR